jgi:RNA-binding protein 5/10
MLQCNEPRTDDAPSADMTLSNPPSSGKKGFEAGWFEMFLFS